ncbi:MAG: response regulator [Armatimonadetes bacterium]|nr:response regulator [Armatimonadota bacterium]
MNRQVAEHPSVLVVDDDMRTAICVRDCLKATGFRADAVYNAGLGLELSAREGPYDAAIVDIVLSGMSGKEALHALRRMSPTTKLVAMSGHLSDDEIRALANAGVCDAFVRKPFTIRGLVDTVASVLRATDASAPILPADIEQDPPGLEAVFGADGIPQMRLTPEERAGYEAAERAGREHEGPPAPWPDPLARACTSVALEGERMYREIAPSLEREHRDSFVAIDVKDRKQPIVAPSREGAVKKAEATFGHESIYLRRIGGLEECGVWLPAQGSLRRGGRGASCCDRGFSLGATGSAAVLST